jgi:hypothetical protein
MHFNHAAKINKIMAEAIPCGQCLKTQTRLLQMKNEP